MAESRDQSITLSLVYLNVLKTNAIATRIKTYISIVQVSLNVGI